MNDTDLNEEARKGQILLDADEAWHGLIDLIDPLIRVDNEVAFEAAKAWLQDPKNKKLASSAAVLCRFKIEVYQRVLDYIRGGAK